MAIVCLTPFCTAQEHLSERVYISTDRDVYVAGDDMFFSAFCMDMATGRMSGGSAVAYLEIISPEGPVQTGKVALQKGRGGGVISLQNTIPTGNYKLVAYTAQCFNEDGYDFEEGARLISIINPFTTERSSAGVEIVEDDVYAGTAQPSAARTGSVRVSGSGEHLVLTNTSDKPVSVSVSVTNNDGIVPPGASTPMTFLAGASRGTSFTSRRTFEYEGEIIRARVRGVSSDGLTLVKDADAFFSIPGHMSDVYSSKVDDDGLATFYTRNVYGNEEAFLEIRTDIEGCHLDIESPFEGVRATGLAPLRMARGLEDRIVRRSLGMQIQKASHADSLYGRLEIPEDLIFHDGLVEYKLDDYTRFPLMEELFIEFIKEIRVRRDGDDRSVVVFLLDSYKPAPFSQLPTLVLLDGVPVLDHNKIFDYDPLLVEKVVIYQHTVNLGGWYYAGVANFITYKGNLPSYEFDDNVRVVNFQGTSYPVTAYRPVPDSSLQDLRQTALWHPTVEIGPGESRELNFVRPQYDGHMEVVVEGFDADGAPQFVKSRFD